MADKKEQSSLLSKLSLALSGIDACLAIMDELNENDINENNKLITKARAHVEDATEALITIKTTLAKL